MSAAFSSFAFSLVQESDTERLARLVAQSLSAHRAEIAQQGFNLRLEGNLGAGKTSFTRALLRSLGVTGRVRSPTFELVEDYEVLGMDFHHFDFYRFASPVEFDEAGFRDLFGPGSITAGEWCEKAGSFLPPADLTLSLLVVGTGRQGTLKAASALGEKVVTEVQSPWQATAEP